MTHKTLVWRKTRGAEYPEIENFLSSREVFCVNACSRFIAKNYARGHLWNLRDAKGDIAAFLLHSRLSLLPIFTDRSRFIIPRFLERFLGKIAIHSVQGLKADTEILEHGIRELGFYNTDCIDYDIMTLDQYPRPECFGKGPAGMTIRLPLETDKKELFELHSAYEQEEVVPRGGAFSPEGCLLTLERLMTSELMLVACIGDKIIGKINTNAKSFTRSQIGGVYVRPEYRGMGVAQNLSAVFVKELIEQGRGASLYVKKRNSAARNVYRRLGFVIRGDYRISYY